MSSSIAHASVAEETDIAGSDAGVEFGPSHQPTPTPTPNLKASCVEKQQRVTRGILIAMVTGLLWTGLTELLKWESQGQVEGQATKVTILSEGYDNDTLKGTTGLTYICSAWLLLAYPPYLVVHTLIRHRSTREVLRESMAVYAGVLGQEHRHWPHIWKTALLLLTWVLALYTYIKGLSMEMGAADMTSLYATNHSFVYMLSWIVLFEKFVAIRILAMIFSITGIVLFAYVDGVAGKHMLGVVVAVTSSSLTAINKVLFRKYVGDASVGQATLLLSFLGLLIVVLLWPVWVAVQLTGVETVDWARAPWHLLLAAAAFHLVYHVLLVCARHATCKEATGLGVALSVPLCAVIDTAWRGQTFTGMKIAAFVLITLGLLLILLPDNWTHMLVKPFKDRKRQAHRNTHTPTGNHTLRSRLTRTTYM